MSIWLLGYTPMEAYRLTYGLTDAECREAITSALACYRKWQRDGRAGPRAMSTMRHCIMCMCQSAMFRKPVYVYAEDVQ